MEMTVDFARQNAAAAAAAVASDRRTRMAGLFDSVDRAMQMLASGDADAAQVVEGLGLGRARDRVANRRFAA